MKRTAVMDSNHSTDTEQIRLLMSASKPLPSTSCLNNLFSDLSVKRTNSKRVWGGIGSRKSRHMCLVSLVKECKSTQCDRTPLSTLGPNALLREPLSPPTNDTQTEVKPLFSCGFFALREEEDAATPIEF